MTAFLNANNAIADNNNAIVSAKLPLVEEAVQALAVLGFAPAPTQKVVMQIVKDAPDTPVEDIIKKALKML